MVKAELKASRVSSLHKVFQKCTALTIINFSSVAHLPSVRTLLAFAIEKRMIIYQMDVVSVFLNGELKEEIYVQQPQG